MLITVGWIVMKTGPDVQGSSEVESFGFSRSATNSLYWTCEHLTGFSRLIFFVLPLTCHAEPAVKWGTKGEVSLLNLHRYQLNMISFFFVAARGVFLILSLLKFTESKWQRNQDAEKLAKVLTTYQFSCQILWLFGPKEDVESLNPAQCGCRFLNRPISSQIRISCGVFTRVNDESVVSSLRNSFSFVFISYILLLLLFTATSVS